jgi:hypothetical protein
MTLRLIGAGLGRTGTHSLKLALESLLGGRCYHMVEVFENPPHFARWTALAMGEKVDLHALMDGYVATVDWPSAAFWPELAAAFPDAPILLSTRSSAASWWKSASETIFAPRPEPTPPPMRMMLDAMLAARFTPDVRDAEKAMAAYEKHNAHVRATAPKERLVEWTPADGWGPICKALRVAVPDRPFPHSNTTAEFQARLASGGPPVRK